MLLRSRTILLAVALICLTAAASWAVDVTVDPGELNLAYMNVFELDGTTFIYGEPWGFNDLVAFYTGPELTLGPNSIGDPNEYWYQCLPGNPGPNCGEPGAPGNKVMEANAYGERTDGSLAGVTVVFSGEVLSNTLTDAHEAYVFIRDFAPNFSSVVEVKEPLPLSGPFGITLDTINDPARPVQWGFQVKGVNVWITDVEPFGNAVVGPFGPISQCFSANKSNGFRTHEAYLPAQSAQACPYPRFSGPYGHQERSQDPEGPQGAWSGEPDTAIIAPGLACRARVSVGNFGS
jgi:hypothetical protein